MLKLNVGFNRKAGEANYGSRGASVNLELECDSGLIDQPDRLRDRIRHLFNLAKASVDEELNGQGAAQSNGHAQANGNGQVRALHAIAQRQQLDVRNVVHSRYGVDTPEDLSITEASELIDELKAQASGKGTGGRR